MSRPRSSAGSPGAPTFGSTKTPIRTITASWHAAKAMPKRALSRVSASSCAGVAVRSGATRASGLDIAEGTALAALEPAPQEAEEQAVPGRGRLQQPVACLVGDALHGPRQQE